MMIRLIMQGGRRKPLAPAGGTIASSSSSSGSGKEKVRVMLESKGRRGKQVTCITGLSLSASELDNLASRLKQSCGTGGTVKEGRIEIQGDNCDRVLTVLVELGYNAKRAGAPSKRR
ncbi:stress response translation initiation inhibitor YciH [bacterium]|nr:stress response translation initiation inhibitor YciH [bacterium]